MLRGLGFNVHIDSTDTNSESKGFTLVELMVSIAIIAVLIGLLSPAIGGVLGSARGVKCQASLRTIAEDFHYFADDAVHPNRGDDERLRNRFRLSTFQEHEYGIDEFWAFGSAESHEFAASDQQNSMQCASVHGAVTVRRDQACTSSGAIDPPQSVSYGMNSRLHRAEIDGPGGFPLPRPVLLTADILQQPDVPLAWDVDGATAFEKGVLPQFSAPSLGSKAVYAWDRFWFPGFRHGGVINVAFVGGHVLATKSPLEETAWRWDYQPIN
jgi:prepilin-type N-terminal cleavage/methylation domain-containing protein/prepilin-type processing-associated H-X9-DG protein